MSNPLGFLRLKVVALAVNDLARAERFYGETLGLPPATEYAKVPVALMLEAMEPS